MAALRGEKPAAADVPLCPLSNPAGLHRELWYHEQGDRSWLVVTRDTVSHEITSVELARDVARARGRSK